MLLCSVAGFDASHRVNDLASSMGKPCTPIALGKGLIASWVFYPVCVFMLRCKFVVFFIEYGYCCLGSAEGFSLAEKAISSASRNGR